MNHEYGDSCPVCNQPISMAMAITQVAYFDIHTRAQVYPSLGSPNYDARGGYLVHTEPCATMLEEKRMRRVVRKAQRIERMSYGK